jgi:hypothetical protein
VHTKTAICRVVRRAGGPSLLARVLAHGWRVCRPAGAADVRADPRGDVSRRVSEVKSVLSQPVERLWREQPHLRTVVGFVSRNIAHLGMQVFERDAEDGRNRMRDTPLAMLLEEPNDDMTQFDLIEATVASRMLVRRNLLVCRAGSESAVRLGDPPHSNDLGDRKQSAATAFNVQAYKVAVPGTSGRWVRSPPRT